MCNYCLYKQKGDGPGSNGAIIRNGALHRVIPVKQGEREATTAPAVVTSTGNARCGEARWVAALNRSLVRWPGCWWWCLK